jgi:DNA-binding transcriptional MerR regulator
MSEQRSQSNIYRIGAVANITGISTHTIRAWERRYGMDLSGRSEGGTRLYPESSLERLHLIKQLLDHGESISVLAHLDADTLATRLNQFPNRAIKGQPAATAPANPPPLIPKRDACALLRIATAGGDFFSLATPDRAASIGVKLVGKVDDASAIPDLLDDLAGDLDAVILHYPVLSTEATPLLHRLANDFPNLIWLILFDFSNDAELIKLTARGLKCLKAPIPDPLLVDWLNCLCKQRSLLQKSDPDELSTDYGLPRFSAEQLRSLSRSPSSPAQEKRAYLASLLLQLQSFENFCTRSADGKNDEWTQGTRKSRSILERLLAQHLD